MNAATAPSTRTATGLKTKFTPVTRSFLRSQIDPKLGWFLMMLEDLAMDRTTGFDDTWGIVYDADLRPTFGSDDTIGRLWAQAENEDQPGGPYLKRIRTAKGARIGFIWLRRPTDRPVATPATFARAQAELEAAVAGRRGRARTIPIPSEDPCTYRRFAGAPTADLRVHLPQICGGSGGAPLEERARDLDPENTEKTTTTRAESSSFLTPSHQTQDPELLDRTELTGPVASPPVPAAYASTHVPGEDPAAVAEAVRQAEALFGPGMLKLVCQAILTFTLAWVLAALYVARKRFNPGKSRKAVEDWGYVWRTLENFQKQGGPSPKILAALEGQLGSENPRASPSRRNEARQVLDAIRNCGLDIIATRRITQDTGETTWSYAMSPGDWSQLEPKLQKHLEEFKPEIRELVRRETEAHHGP
jgi:hypothetical protein